MKCILLFAALFSFAACDTDVKQSIPQADAPVLISTTPVANASGVKRGEITIELEYDQNISFDTKNQDKISFSGGKLLSADVFGVSKVFTLKVQVEERGAACKLSFPEGLVLGIGRMPAPGVDLQFTTADLDKSPVSATSAGAVKLYDYLLEVYERKILSAMMAEVSWNTTMAECVYRWTGKYPAINCFDYIHMPASEAGANWIDYTDITPVKQWADAGGIVSLMWHWNVPKKAIPLEDDSEAKPLDPTSDYAFYAKDTEFDAAKALTAGTWENKVFLKDMETAARYLKLLKEAGIPVLWRPFHEAAGGWFWWGKDAGSLKAMWIKMFDYFKSQGLDNLIWVWTTETGDADWYPGDQYVDIIGRDIYTKNTANCVSQYVSISSAYGNKMVTLSECGSVGLVSEQWSAGGKWSWFMPWYDGTNEDGTPIVHADEAWWNDAMKLEFVVSRESLPCFVIP